MNVIIDLILYGIVEFFIWFSKEFNEEKGYTKSKGSSLSGDFIILDNLELRGNLKDLEPQQINNYGEYDSEW